MFSLRDLTILLHGAGWLLIVLFAVLFIFVLFIYRKTNPIVSNRMRYLLLALRVIALLGALFIIFEPTLGVSYNKKTKPTLAVLIDNSVSMALTDAEGKRDSVVASVLDMSVFPQLQEKCHLKYYKFAAMAERISKDEIDSIQYFGDATDIRHSLETVQSELIDENLTGMILITDGAYNLGGNPVRFARDTSVPIYPIVVGSNQDVRDLAIAQVSANKFAYVGSGSPVNVKLRNLGFPDTRTIVNLKTDERVVDSKNIIVPKAPADVDLSLHFTAEKEGSKKYSVEIASLEGEQTYLNNIKSFTVDVLKSKMKILLISGSVNSDLGFMRRMLASDDNYDLSVVVEKGRERFYNDGSDKLADISDFDIVILLDYPQDLSDSNIISKLSTALDDYRIPVVFFIGSSTSSTLVKRFQQYLPLRGFKTKTESLISVEPILAEKNHPILNISNKENNEQWDWKFLPPVFDRVNDCSIWPDSRVLASSIQGPSGRNRGIIVTNPAIVVRNFEGRRSVAVLVHGLWRWSLLMAGIGNDGECYEHLISNLIRWSTKSSDDGNVVFSTSSSSYRCDETIIFQAEVYDDNYRPFDDANVTVTVKSGTRLWDVGLRSTGNGHYFGELGVNLPGEYVFEGRASDDGRELGVDDGRFSVGEYEAELLETRAQVDLLQMIAKESKGKFFSPDSANTLLTYVRANGSSFIRYIEFELWNKFIIAASILFALILEWYLRKRKGMV